MLETPRGCQPCFLQPGPEKTNNLQCGQISLKRFVVKTSRVLLEQKGFPLLPGSPRRCSRWGGEAVVGGGTLEVFLLGWEGEHGDTKVCASLRPRAALPNQALCLRGRGASSWTAAGKLGDVPQSSHCLAARPLSEPGFQGGMCCLSALPLTTRLGAFK